MLEIRENCENCGKSLPNECGDAMICTFECTYCLDCVTDILHNVCPNCGGGFEKRPVRPKRLLEKYPTRGNRILQPIDYENFNRMLDEYRDIKPYDR
jgi:hypothetical protein